MREWIIQHKTYVKFGAIGAVFLAVFAVASMFGNGLVFQSDKDTDWLENDQVFLEDKKAMSVEETSGETEEKIMVDVKGAVKNPGVYFARPGDRVIDVIEDAGGLLENADDHAINFAMKLTDEMVIYVPRKGEDYQGNGGMAVVASGGKNDGKVNLNRADRSELETLPGIGPSKAEAIIEYRETKGPFKTIEDLKLVSGVGEKTFEKLKDKITVK